MTGRSPNGHSRIAASRPARLGVLVSYLRPEEKSILAAARERGIEVAPIFDRDLVLDLSSPHAPAADSISTSSSTAASLTLAPAIRSAPCDAGASPR